MDEQQLLSRLRRGDEQALAAVIARFSAYVVTVIHNRSRGLLVPGGRGRAGFERIFRALAVLPGRQGREHPRVARERGAEQDRRPAAKGAHGHAAGRGAGRDGRFSVSRRPSKRSRRGSCARRSRCCRRSDREIIRRFYDLCQTAPEICRRAGADPCRGAHAAGTQPGSHQKRVMPGRVCI